MIDFELMASNSGRRPSCIGHELLEFRDQKFQQLATGWKRIRNAHHELDLAGSLEQTAIGHDLCIVKHRHVENLDLRLDAVLKHRSCELLDKLRWIFIDLRGKIDRPCGERGHIGLEVEHPPAFVLASATAASGKLHDHLGAMLEDALLDQREKLRIRTGAFVGIAHVNMRNRSPGFEGFVRGFDLLAWCHRHRRRIGFARNCTRNSDSDDCGGRHARHLACLDEMDRSDVAPLRDFLKQCHERRRSQRIVGLDGAGSPSARRIRVERRRRRAEGRHRRQMGRVLAGPSEFPAPSRSPGRADVGSAPLVMRS